MANNTEDVETRHDLNDVVHDMLGEVFCGDCEHPRCTRKVGLYKRVIEEIIQQEANRQKLELLERLEDVLPPVNRLEVGDGYNNGYTDAESYFDVAVQKEKGLNNW